MRLSIFLLTCSVAFAQPPNPFVNGTIADANAVNAFLNTKASKFSGFGVPGTVVNSTLGDIYLNRTTGDLYVCLATPGPCTAVAAGNWKLGTGGGGGSPGGSADDIQVNVASSFGGSRGKLDAVGNFTVAGSASAAQFVSTDTLHTAVDFLKGKTSGGKALTVNDVGGAAVAYIWPATDGLSGQALTDNGVVACPSLPSGSPTVCHALIWVTPSSVGCTTSGSSGQIIIGDGMGGCTNATGAVYSAGAITLGTAGSVVGALKLANATSGLVTIQPVTGALGASVFSIPAATDTAVGKATTDTLTNKTFDTAGSGNSLKISGTSITAVSGSGAVCLATGSACGGGSSFSNFQKATSPINQTGSDVTIYSVSAPALAADACYRIEFGLLVTPSAHTVIRVYVDSTLIATPYNDTGTLFSWQGVLLYCNNASVQNAQSVIYPIPGIYNYGPSSVWLNTNVDAMISTPTGVDWSTSHTITLKTLADNATTNTGQYWHIATQ